MNRLLRLFRRVLAPALAGLAAAALLCASPASLAAEYAAASPGDPAMLMLVVDPPQAYPGATIKASVHVKIEPGWRLASLTQPSDGPPATRLEFKWPAGVLPEGPIESAAPEIETSAEGDFAYYEDQAVFVQQARIAADAPPGVARIEVDARYFLRSEAFRVPEKSLALGADLEVLAAAPAEPAEPPATPAEPAPSPSPGATLGFGGFGAGRDKLLLSARFEPAQAAPGGTTRLVVRAEIDPGWHTYSMTQPPGGPKSTTIKTNDAEGLEPLGDFQGPPPVEKMDPAFNMMVESHSGAVEFAREYRVSPTAPPGELSVTGLLNAMLCDPTSCLPPRNFPFEARLAILEAVEEAPIPPSAPIVSAPVASPAPPPAPAAPEQAVLAEEPAAPPAAAAPTLDDLFLQGLWVFIGFSMAAGFAALLTPCVFPMIPITVSFFTKRSGRTSWAAIRQAAAYSASIIASFMALGLLLSLFLGATGASRFAANPFVNLFIGGLFVVFALSLFGAFEITIPTGWIGGMGAPGGSGGYASILGMGFVFTLTSFTCTVGFVGLVLVSASQGQWYQPAVGMFFFALAFSLPFFLLALFPQWLSRLPKSGGWLNSIKVVMGLLEVAFAFKFFSNVDLAWEWGLFTRPVLLALWTATAAVTGLYLLRLFRLSSDPEHDGSLGATRLLIAMGFLGFALYLSRGLFGIPLNGFIESYLPPRDMAPAFGLPEGAAAEELRWIDDYETALAQARAEGKTLFIDFTGVFCNNCRLMEQGMFPRPAIRDALGRFTLARLYTDKGTPETDANQRMQVERFGTPALPLYALVDPATEATIRSFAGMTRDEGKFLEFLTGAVASD